VNSRAPSLTIALLIVLFACSAFVIGRETSPKSSNQPRPLITRTSVDFVTPWTASGTLSAQEKVTSRVSGSCWTGSLNVNESDAWRCASGNAIYDPCFSSFSYEATDVACLISPWTGVVLLRLTKPLPTSQRHPVSDKSEPSPDWALELSDGDHCVLVSGTIDTLGGVLLPYYCSSGALAGTLNMQSEPWTVEYYRSGSDVLYDVNVKVAWGG
jgi:hypothetical protein